MRIIRTGSCVVVLVGVAGGAVGQVNQMPPDMAQKVGNAIARMIPAARGAPFKVDPVVGRTVGLTAQGGLAIVMCPARGLTAEKVAGAGDEPTPAGVLAMKGVQLLIDDKAFPAEKLIQLGGDSGRSVPAFWLAVKKVDGKPSLLFCGKDDETRGVPLKRVEAEGDEAAALKFVGLEGDRAGRFEITLCGEYRASFILGAR
ncbi:MAG: hypothetical protein ACE5O2_00905 [Armatimonadota bacterium]